MAFQLGASAKPMFFAIKELRRQLDQPGERWPTEELKESWFQQLALLRSLRHPHVVRYVDLFRGFQPHFAGNAFGEPDAATERWYLQMEWVHGRTLEELVHANETPPDVVVRHVGEIALALAYLQQGSATGGSAVLHRDIKPSSIVFNAEIGAVLVDFGLASVHDADLSSRGMRTLGYTAPLVVSDPSCAGPASELSSLAATAYFGLTGAHPTPSAISEMRERLQDALQARVSSVVVDVRLREVPQEEAQAGSLDDPLRVGRRPSAHPRTRMVTVEVCLVWRSSSRGMMRPIGGNAKSA